MTIAQAQADVRRAYRGGYSGPLVSAFIWAAANSAYFLVSPGAAMAALFFGGMLIFPISALILRSTRSGSLPKGHPSTALAMQSAFTVPFGLLVAIVLGSFAPELFFPASLIIVGAHYLVFISPYGMKIYAVLGGALVVIGAAAIFVVPDIGSVSGWVGAVVFLASAPFLYRSATADRVR
jgi:hypothetical protein